MRLHIEIRAEDDEVAGPRWAFGPIEVGGSGPEMRLLEWWLETAIDDFIKTAPKMFEYGGESSARPGSADLRIIGEGLMELLGWPVNQDTEAIAQELGCWFYLLGKSGRLISNYQQKQPGKQDTWFDIGIYAKMARRIQETGNWP